MHKFNYSFILNNDSVQMAVGKNDCNSNGNSNRINSIICSNAIEQITLTPKEAEIVFRTGANAINYRYIPAMRLVANYAECYDIIAEKGDKIDLTVDLIKSIHKTLFKGVSSEVIGGKWKHTDNCILSTDSNGNSKVLFRPTTAIETPEEMTALVQEYLRVEKLLLETADTEAKMIRLISCFVLDFLRIHPFEDGNGRVGRLLTGLLMRKNGWKAWSLEEATYNNLEEYYWSLQEDKNTLAAAIEEGNAAVYDKFTKFFITIIEHTVNHNIKGV